MKQLQNWTFKIFHKGSVSLLFSYKSPYNIVTFIYISHKGKFKNYLMFFNVFIFIFIYICLADTV